MNFAFGSLANFCNTIISWLSATEHSIRFLLNAMRLDVQTGVSINAATVSA